MLLSPAADRRSVGIQNVKWRSLISGVQGGSQGVLLVISRVMPLTKPLSVPIISTVRLSESMVTVAHNAFSKMIWLPTSS